jgi:hypothetical protein
VVLYVNKNKKFQVRYFNDTLTKKYKDKDYLNENNYNEIISKIITQLGIDTQLSVRDVIQQLYHFIKLYQNKIYEGDVMYNAFQTYHIQEQHIKQLSPDAQLRLNSFNERTAYISNFNECLKKLDTNDIVKYIGADGKCMYSEDESSVSFDDLQEYKKQKISKANECVNDKMKECFNKEICNNMKTVIENNIRAYATNGDVIKIDGKDVNMKQCTL